MTAIKLTLADVLALAPCDRDERVKLFGRRKTLTAAQALKAGASIDDLLWVAGRIGRKDLCVRFALVCAKRVAHLNPDPRVMAALEAASAWLSNPCDETRAAARAAAIAAARAASDAAWAAAWAAWAARAAASDAARAEQQRLFLEIFG